MPQTNSQAETAPLPVQGGDVSQPPQVEAVKPKRGKAILFLVLLLILLLIAAGATGVYLLWKKNSAKSTQGENAQDEDANEVNEEGELESEEEVDPYEGWLTYANSAIGITLEYPSDWVLTDYCQQQNVKGDCGIEVSKGNYTWNLMLDPFITGGGFGFLLADLPSAAPSVVTAVTPGNYNVFMLNGYITAAQVNQLLIGEVVLPSGNDYWENSMSFRSQTDFMNNFGFGPGQMYDDTLGNFFEIQYRYDIQGNYNNLRIKGSAELTSALTTFDLITNSLVLP